MATARTITAEAVILAVDKFSAPMQRMAASMDAFAGRASSIRAAGTNFAEAGKQIAQAGAAVSATSFLTLKSAIKDYADFEDQLVKVKKVFANTFSDAYRNDEMKKIEQGIVSMSRVVPLATKALAELAEAAGQANIGDTAADILKFTQLGAEFTKAFDVPAKEAGESLAKLKTQLNTTIDGVRAFADMLNYLGNNSAAKERDLLSFATRTMGMITNLERLGGSAREGIMALGSTLISTGTEWTTAGVAVSNFTNRVMAGESAAKRVREALVEMGLAPGEVAARMASDWEGTTKDIFERINKLSPDRAAAVMKDLAGEYASRQLIKIAADMTEFNRQLGLANDKKAQAGSVAKEYGVSIDTLNSKLTILHNKLGAIAKTMLSGPAFEGMKNALDKIGGALEMIFSNKYTAWMAGIGAFLIVIGPALIGVGLTLIGLAKAFGVLGAAISAAVGMPLLGIVAIIAAVSYAMYLFSDKFRAAADKVGAALKYVATELLTFLGDLIGGVTTRVVQALGNMFSLDAWKGRLAELGNQLKMFVETFITSPITAGIRKIGEAWNWLAGKREPVQAVPPPPPRTAGEIVVPSGAPVAASVVSPPTTPELQTPRVFGGVPLFRGYDAPPGFMSGAQKAAETYDPLARVGSEFIKQIESLATDISMWRSHIARDTDRRDAASREAAQLGGAGTLDGRLKLIEVESLSRLLVEWETRLERDTGRKGAIEQQLRDVLPPGGKFDVQGEVQGKMQGEFTIRIPDFPNARVEQNVTGGDLRGPLNTGRSMPDVGR